MKIKNILAFGLSSLALLSCGSTIDDIASSRVTSNVPVTEEDGVVTATLPTDSESLVVASAAAESKESYVTVPAGTLALETEVKLGDANDLSAGILAASGIDPSSNAIVQKTAPFFAGPTGSQVALGGAGTIAISLPLPVDGQLNLTTAEGKLVFLYLVYTSNGYRAGIKALTADNLVGTFAQVDIKGFGYFQLAFLAQAVEDVEYVAYSNTLPSLAD